MKKFLLLALLFVGFQSQAQISDAQWTIITKKSADWCPNCGGWAWPVFEDIQDDLKDKNAITLLMHHTGGLSNPAAEAITDNIGGVYQPEFFLNNDIQNIGPSNAADKRTEIIEQVDALSSFPAFAGIALEAYVDVDAERLSVKADVEFFEELGNDFSLGLYLVQTNIMHNQAGQGNVVQPRLLTDHITDEIFGDELIGNKGIEIVNYSYELPDTWALGELEVVAILWLKDASGTYRVFNANYVDNIESLLSNNELEEVVGNYSASINQQTLSINLEATTELNDARVFLTTLEGKNVYSATASNILNGTNQFSFDVPNLSTGLYIVTLEIDGRQVSQKVLAK